MPAAALTGRGRPGAVSSACLWAVAKDQVVKFPRKVACTLARDSAQKYTTIIIIYPMSREFRLHALSGRMFVKGGKRPKVAPLVEQIRAVGSFSPSSYDFRCPDSEAEEASIVGKIAPSHLSSHPVPDGSIFLRMAV